MKIRNKLILGFLVVVLFISIVGYISINKSKKTLQESIGESNVILVKETIDKIDRNIYNRIEEMQSYATFMSLSKEAAVSNEEFDKMENAPDFINSVDKDWKEKKETSFIQSILSNELSKVLRKHLEFYKRKYGYPVLAEIYVTNKYGVVIASTGRTSDYLQADEEWYQKATAEKEFWVGEIEYDESSDVFASDIIINLYDENENFVGIFKAVLNIEEVINIIEEIKITHKHKTIGFKLLTKEGKLFAYAESKGYRDYQGLGWILIIEHEVEEIFQPVIKLRNILLIVFLILIIIAIGIGLFLSKLISKPIQELTKASIELEKGNLDYKVIVESKDEIGKLARTFNQMRLKLKEREVLAVKDREDLLNSLLSSFEGKFGNIAKILVRKNIQELVKKNPRIKKILPPILSKSISESEKIKKLGKE